MPGGTPGISPAPPVSTVNANVGCAATSGNASGQSSVTVARTNNPLKGSTMANKNFEYRVAYYPAAEVEANVPTKRQSDEVIVEATSVTRAISKAKREGLVQTGDLIVSVKPINAERYSV